MVATTTMPPAEAVRERPAHEGNAVIERRRRHRFRLMCAVRLSRSGLERFSEHWTDEVSCEGFSCLSRFSFTAGEILDCELTITPGYWTDALEQLVLRCQVEVMRSSRKSGDGGFTLACRLLDYTTSVPWIPLPTAFEVPAY